MAAIGGRPAVRFHGDDFLSLATLIGMSTGDQTFHVSVVLQAPAGSAHGAQWILDLNSRDAPDAAFEKRFGFWVGYRRGGAGYGWKFTAVMKVKGRPWYGMGSQT
ncbi:MAG: hypothetical protein GY826_40290 [Fuerstiella sp.]|nr:hypothetical protein [Fuerstiella sp.]